MLQWNQLCIEEIRLYVCVCMRAFVVSLLIVLSFHVQIREYSIDSEGL